MRNKSRHQKDGKLHFSALVMRIAALLACLALITAYLLSGAYSKFFSGASGGDSARVALFSPDVTSTEITVENELPGFPKVTDNSYNIDFTVKNYSDEKVPEVAMKYKIVLKTTGNLPLKFTLLSGDEKTTLESWECVGTSGEQIYEYTDGSLVFGTGVKESQDYQLKVEWNPEKNDARFSGKTDAVYLEVEFEQID